MTKPPADATCDCLADKTHMSLFGCCRNTFKTLSRAAAKSAAAKLRDAGALRAAADWVRRAEICRSCPLRITRRGISYCGKPLLQQVDRIPAQGCGCPILDKAKDPAEHCPLSATHLGADHAVCNCKWCVTTTVAEPRRHLAT